MQPSAYKEMSEVEGRHWWFEGRRQILASVLRRLRNGMTEPTILEIGAGTGGNVSMLQEIGTVTGVELDDNARQMAEQNFRVKLLAGSLPDGMPAFSELFDFVCMFDVLEHIENDVEALRAAARYLKRSGYLVLTVPADPTLWSQHDVQLHHKRRYTRESLASAVNRADLSLARISHFNTLLYPVAWVTRRLKPSMARGMKAPLAPVNALFRCVMSSERALLRHSDLPVGLSLLAVVRKG